MFCRINMGNSVPLACSLWGRNRRFWSPNYKQHKRSMTFYQLCSGINKWLWWGNTRVTCFQLPHFHRFEHAPHSTEKRGHVEAKHFFLYTDTSTWTYIVLAHLRSCPHYTTEHYHCTAYITQQSFLPSVVLLSKQQNRSEVYRIQVLGQKTLQYL